MPASTDIVVPVIQSTLHNKLQEEWTLTAKGKKRDSHKVIIHLLKKENLPTAETDSGGEAGYSEK